MTIARIRPTILLAVLGLITLGGLALWWGQTEITATCAGGLVASIAKIMESEEAVEKEKG